MQHRAAQAQHARKMYTRSTLTYNVSVLFKIDYTSSQLLIFLTVFKTAP